MPLVSPDGELLVQRERQAPVKVEKQHRELMNDCFSLKERLAEERVPGPLLLTSLLCEYCLFCGTRMVLRVIQNGHEKQ